MRSLPKLQQEPVERGHSCPVDDGHKNGDNDNDNTNANNDFTSPAQPKSTEQPEDFTAWYLRKATSEFADDLDKLRSTNDFTDESLQMLIFTLKQSEMLFEEEEKRRILGA